MSKPSVRAGAIRVLANALLVLLAYEVVTLGAVVAQVVLTGWTLPMPPIQMALMVTAFILVRWLFVLPGLLLVLAGIEVVARRVAHARLLTTAVAFAPMVWWALTQGSGDTSSFNVVLGLIAVLFAAMARLPDRLPENPPAVSGATPPTPESAVAPR
jgi:hypothetical protein